MTDLHWLSAIEAAALIKTKKLSPREYVDAILDRIADLQPKLNCFATVTADEARKAAVGAEKAVMDGDPVGPLHGVPVNIKDLFNTAGIRTAHGSAIFANNVPKKDDILVTRLKNAGAIVIGKSTTPEFGHKGMTDSPTFGVTRNPWDPGFSSGGSSGGAASAVASGQGPLGLGTDGAGSIRIPAATCGTVGHKPTMGLVPFEIAADSFANYGYAGPLTRTVADTAVMMDVISGPVETDPWTMHPFKTAMRPNLVHDRLDGLRIGYIPKMANLAVDPDVTTATERTIGLLAGQGATVDECRDEIDWIEYEGRILYMGGQLASYGGYEAEWADKMDPTIRAYIADGRNFSLVEYRHAQFARTRLFKAVQKLFEKFDFLVTPTLPTPGLAANHICGTDAININGTTTTSSRIGWGAFVYPFNLTGHPALSIPSGLSKAGVPIGFQIVGPWWSDVDLFRIGSVLERLNPWANTKPPVS